MVIGAIITGVVVTTLVNDEGLNLSGIIKTLGTIAAWLPMAVVLQKMGSK